MLVLVLNTGGVSCGFVSESSSLGGVLVGGSIYKDMNDTIFPLPGTSFFAKRPLCVCVNSKND